ncbi:hypothetical protein [Methylobacter sp.]|uniref:hypothetical protein n=1 Tax=Methylobacter sp. TaxID=2051955 RepID=UPI003DA5F0EB
MAHVIAKSPAGPRGVESGGDDTYENLLLLCPTHHTEVDKSPAGTFPPEVLLDWKHRHEASIAAALVSPSFAASNELAEYILRLLIENRTVWKTYGPESVEAQANPMSNLASVWAYRKLDTIVPNNRKIVEAIRKNSNLFDVQAYESACAFVEHAEGFERNCYERTEAVPRFPQQFEAMVRRYAGIQ